MTTHFDNPQDTANPQGAARRNQLLWFAGAIGTTVGVAVWAYSRRELSYWDRTKRTAGQIAETATDINPRLGIAGAAALGSAALAYRLRGRKSSGQKVGERANALWSQTGKQLRPWVGVIASALSAASATYSPKSRRRVAETVTDTTANAARRLQTISAETGKLYTRARKVIA